MSAKELRGLNPALEHTNVYHNRAVARGLLLNCLIVPEHNPFNDHHEQTSRVKSSHLQPLSHDTLVGTCTSTCAARLCSFFVHAPSFQSLYALSERQGSWCAMQGFLPQSAPLSVSFKQAPLRRESPNNDNPLLEEGNMKECHQRTCKDRTELHSPWGWERNSPCGREREPPCGWERDPPWGWERDPP